MGADGAANRAALQPLRLTLPEGTAVLDVRVQQAVIQTGIAGQHRPGEVHAAVFLDELGQQVIALFGAAGLAGGDNDAVRNGQHRLDGQQTADHRRRLGEAAALVEIVQVVRGAKDADFFLLPLQRRRDFRRRQAAVPQLGRPQGQDLLADGDIVAVHHEDAILQTFGGDLGALGRAGQLLRHGDDHRRVASLQHLSVGLLEVEGRCLAGLGNLAGRLQLLIEFPAGHIPALDVLAVGENGLQGHDPQAVPLDTGRLEVSRRVHNDLNAHRFVMRLLPADRPSPSASDP